VPVLNLVLAELPAQIYDAALAEIRKITQPLVGIFQYDPHVFDLVDQNIRWETDSTYSTPDLL
jgi:hypothetical protein